VSALEAQPSIIEEIKLDQKDDTKFEKIRQNIKKIPEFIIHEDGTLRFQDQLCVYDRDELKRRILEEAHNTCYPVQPRGIQMFRGLG